MSCGVFMGAAVKSLHCISCGWKMRDFSHMSAECPDCGTVRLVWKDSSITWFQTHQVGAKICPEGCLVVLWWEPA